MLSGGTRRTADRFGDVFDAARPGILVVLALDGRGDRFGLPRSQIALVTDPPGVVFTDVTEIDGHAGRNVLDRCLERRCGADKRYGDLTVRPVDDREHDHQSSLSERVGYLSVVFVDTVGRTYLNRTPSRSLPRTLFVL